MSIDDPKSQERMYRFFTYEHLPPKLQDVSRDFCVLAEKVILRYPAGPERTVCLRKLLEAKDCAVRCVLEGAGA